MNDKDLIDYLREMITAYSIFPDDCKPGIIKKIRAAVSQQAGTDAQHPQAVIVAELDKIDDECMTLALPGDRIRCSLRTIRQQLTAC